MPTVPDFKDDEVSKIAWLRDNFNSRDDFMETVNQWDVQAQRCDAAVTGAGYVAGICVTILSTIQTAIIGSDNAGNTSNIFSYVQTGIGVCTLLIGGVCKLIKDSNAAARDSARAQIPTAFFQAEAGGPRNPATIWENASLQQARNRRGACLC